MRKARTNRGIVAEQFAGITRRWPNATLARHADGSHVVRLPTVHLEHYRSVPDEERMTWVEFVLPVGFPFACPADFTTGPLRQESGSVPMCFTGDGQWYWPHRLHFWNAQRDTVLTYVRTVLRRLNGHPTAPREGTPARPEPQP